ncbi:YHYH domain-containing protein [Flavobacterium yafengii]|uniref:YHYH domain-containing protein n=1 Tax=Flavobacterium yafengii TaxID=3041253 RepID=UPI0024A8AEE7|nr:YHYH domain-containing protein [Flavobacterium yafengii]MDI6047431.1 YHYH domain-containing protein [Flavobacterium yafengii]
MKNKIIIILMFCYCNVLSHSGRTDGNGGHYNRKTGEYHHHNGSSGVGKFVIGGIILLLISASGKKNRK